MLTFLDGVSFFPWLRFELGPALVSAWPSLHCPDSLHLVFPLLRSTPGLPPDLQLGSGRSFFRPPCYPSICNTASPVAPPPLHLPHSPPFQACPSQGPLQSPPATSTWSALRISAPGLCLCQQSRLPVASLTSPPGKWVTLLPAAKLQKNVAG